jgi:superfamily II DNA or RNA helicase
MTIKIEYHSEVFLRVFAGSSIEQELSDFFRFRVEGYQWTPAFKNKLWDGYVRLYNLQTKTIYLGLIDYIYEFAKRNDYEVEVDSNIFKLNGTTIEEVQSFADSLNLYGRGKPIQIKDYQVQAVQTAIDRNRVLLLSPTSSGKSLMIYTLLRHHLNQDRKCIIVVPSTQLVEQLYADFEDYSSANGFKVSENCQKLYSGFSKLFEKEVLITTWQSVINQPKPWFNQFDVVINDECHLAKAKSLTSILEKLDNAKYRIGTTGTLDGSKVNKLVLEGLFGRTYQVTTTKELMDNKSVVELSIKCLLLEYTIETKKSAKEFTYQEEMNWLVSHPDRNKFIRNLAISTNGNTLVLFQYVEKHGKKLYEMISEKVTNNRKIYFVHGGVSAIDRENIRSICENDNSAIIIASYGVFSTGISMPSIENIIFASPSKSRIRNLQSIGRGLRLKDGKTVCKLFDITDDLSYKSHKNHTLNHGIERYKIYSQEQFKIKMIKVKLE